MDWTFVRLARVHCPKPHRGQGKIRYRCCVPAISLERSGASSNAMHAGEPASSRARPHLSSLPGESAEERRSGEQPGIVGRNKTTTEPLSADETNRVCSQTSGRCSRSQLLCLVCPQHGVVCVFPCETTWASFVTSLYIIRSGAGGFHFHCTLTFLFTLGCSPEIAPWLRSLP